MQLVIVVAALVVITPLVWAKPIRGVYVLVAAAVVIEIFPLGFQDSLTDVIPFFMNLNNSGIDGLSITPAEIVMAVALIGWWANYAAYPEKVLLPRGRIVVAYSLYMVVVLLAEIRGMLGGGTFNISLWELRPQVYGFILFLLTASLVRERRQLLWLGGIMLVGTSFKAVLGSYRYLFTLNRQIGNFDSILGHEGSFFLALFLVAVACALIWYRRRVLIVPLLLITPIVLFALLENRRRVGILALVVALIVVVLLGIAFEKTVRVRVAIVSAIIALSYGAFIAMNWNKTDGLAGQLVRPVSSVFQPDSRDFSSNLYRQNENANLQYAFNQNRLLGVGFGSPMPVIFPLADISQLYPFWQYIPHNTLLWIGMRMGLIGFMTFFALIGMAILEGVHQASIREDPLLRTTAVFALAAIAAQLIVAYGDLQLENYRNMIFMGTMVGLIDALPQIAVARLKEPVRAKTELLRRPHLASRTV